MRNKKITSLSIAFNNLRLRPIRTACLVIFVTILAFTLLCSNVLSISLENGMTSITKRLGADIIVIPEDGDQKIEGALLRGEPSTFYFDAGIPETVRKVEGVSKVSPQLFIASFSAACCSADIQLIGVDVTTDFVIQPWISDSVYEELKDESILIGSDITAKTGDELMFFGRTYQVAAKLEKTGMGFDTSVFLTMDAAKQAAGDYVKRGGEVAFTGQNEISSIVVDIEDGYDVKKIVNEIKQLTTDTEVITSQNLLSSVSENLKLLLRFLRIQMAVLWLLSFVILALLFTTVINERKLEFGILRAIGATRKKLIIIAFAEASIISVTGSALGNFLSGLILFPFRTYIENTIRLPYLQPSLFNMITIALLNICLSYLSGIASSIFSAFAIGRLETYEMMRREG